MKKFLLIAIGLFLFHTIYGQIPSGYYDSATGSGYTLKTQLYNIIKDHTSVSYSGVWTAFYKTDVKSNGKVWDMYSDVPGGTPAYEYTFGTGQCGTYADEGDCYNREHSFPKSWFNDASPMYTDVFHLYPTDGKVNGMRSNYPFGEVGTASWTSTNGSKLGTCDYPGYTGTVFEPIDEYKGDFARTYFYMATRYQDIIAGWENNTTYSDAVLNGTSDQVYEDWFLNMLIEWHNEDPVSQKEINRNDSIYYNVQYNRNPFIDHPEYVAQIWGGSGVYISNIVHSPTNPTSTDAVTVTATITSSGGTITSADLKWGTSAGSYPNTTTMSSLKGDYTGDIPAGADGTTVYYIIEASDDNAESATSTEHNYSVLDNPPTTIFEEDFETATINSPISINGWTRYDEAGTNTWAGTEYNSNIYAQMTAYASGQTSNISWLITPEINLTNITEATFSFISKDGYNNGDPVEVFISTDYTGTGDPNIANWTKLNPVLATGSTSGYATSFTESGDVDLTSYCGNTIYITYKYTGGDPSLTTTMQIDDVMITGTEASNVAPEISNVSHSPLNPNEGEDVTISATITDSDGTISSANIKWGTTSGTYSNTVSMTNSGDVYSGIIPSQTEGTDVFYIIEATDNSSETVDSDENSFSFSTVNSLPVVSNISNSPLNPDEGEDVTVSATITDSDGTISLANIKWGTISGSYTNTVAMTNSGDDYSGVIPSQSGGTHVYYVIEATDNNTGSTRSEEVNFTFNTVGNAVPMISNLDFTPTNPESDEEVVVTATIIDSDGTVNSAKIKWGTTSGDYPNVIDMFHSGDKYADTIPEQPEGTHVYFIIYAIDEDGGSVQSAEQDYSVNIKPIITNLNFTPTVPESSESVSVTVNITDSDGSIDTAFVKWGTFSGNYTDSVGMNKLANTFSGVIPAQSDKTSVFFIVSAEDDNGAIMESSEKTYTVDDPNATPEISNIIIDPLDPESTESVRISAIITDSDGKIESSTLKWGTTTGSYPNSINMTSDNEDSYLATIPSQSDGTEVFFIITAEDDESGTTTSSEQHYSVEDIVNEAPVISDILFDPTNPTQNDNVVVSCAVNDPDGSVESVLLKWKVGSASFTDINMNLSGGTYYGQIPQQAAGSTVSFTIIAEDNEGLQGSYDGSYEISESSGIEVFSEYSIKVFPNPAKEFLNIQIENCSQQIELNIYDVIGSQVYKSTVEFNSHYKLSLAGLDSGLYFISFVVDNTLITKKIVVKK